MSPAGLVGLIFVLLFIHNEIQVTLFTLRELYFTNFPLYYFFFKKKKSAYNTDILSSNPHSVVAHHIYFGDSSQYFENMESKNIRYLNANILHSLQIAKPNPPFHSHKPNIFSLNHEQQLVKINQHWTHTRQKKKRKNSKPTAAINFLINTCKYLIITYYFCNKQMSSIPSADYQCICNYGRELWVYYHEFGLSANPVSTIQNPQENSKLGDLITIYNDLKIFITRSSEIHFWLD